MGHGERFLGGRRPGARALLASASLGFVAVACGTPVGTEGLPQAHDEVRAALSDMTLEEKAGQTMMCWILSREQGQEGARAELREHIARAGLGGVILSLGTAAEAERLVAELQEHAVACGLPPLLVAGDFEAGVAYRLSGATDLGPAMLLGATGDTVLAHAAGQVTAREAAALGFHWVFAPVVDVNDNPNNPIINVRAFGGDPELVARMGAAFVRGVESVGPMATAKHFPGHGDVTTDSHHELPTVNGDAERLERVELPPFAAVVEAGVSAVMTGHLAVPALGTRPDEPATLCPAVLRGVLRERMAFDGIIVTDALDMGGVRDAVEPAQAACRALAAGADLLLMPPDPVATRDAIVAAVRSGELSRARLDQAVERLLRAKQRLGLLAGVPQRDPAWRRVLGDPRHARVAADIARRGLTMVCDGDDLPLRPGSVTVVSLRATDPGGPVEDGLIRRLREGVGDLRHHVVHADSDPAAVAAASADVAVAEQLVVALYDDVPALVDENPGPSLRPLVSAIRAASQAVFVSFGNPYRIGRVPAESTLICAYGDSPVIGRAAALALLGRAPCTGRLPVDLPGIAPRGTGQRGRAGVSATVRDVEDGR